MCVQTGCPRAPRPRRAWLLPALLVLSACVRSGPPAPGEQAFAAASSRILTYQGEEAIGNDAEARRLAERFGYLLSVMRKAAFTKGKEGAPSLSEGHFLTYCERRADSVLFLVHVPELRRFTKDARDALLDISWMCARQATEELRSERDLRLGVGLKGALLYGGLAVGPGASEEPEVKQGGAAAVDQKVFYAFFTGAPAPAVVGARPSPPAAAVTSRAEGPGPASAPRPTWPGVFALRGERPGLAFALAPRLLATASDRLGAGQAAVNLEGADGAVLHARVVAHHEALGLALLAPDRPVAAPLPLGSPAGLKSGDQVQGVAIPVVRFQRLRVDGGAMLLDSEAAPAGLAVGGPLLNAQGQVVGIAVLRPGREQAEFVAIDHVTDLVRSRDTAAPPAR